MSLDAQDWVWEHSRAKGTARLVLLAIADKASGRDCSAYAGTTMLVQRSNAARSSVVVAVDRLLALGELQIVPGRVGPRGETRYRLPLAAKHTRKPQDVGGPKSGPVQNPDPSGIRTPGGTESGPPRSENRTPTGPESGPHNAVNAGNAVLTQREGSPSSTSRPTATPAANALSVIPTDWEPSIDAVRAAQRARTDAGHATLTGEQLAALTRKFVRRQHADHRQLTPAAWTARWQEWAERERPADNPQAPLLFGLTGGNAPRWPHEQPGTPATPVPPSYAERMAQLDAIARADTDTA